MQKSLAISALLSTAYSRMSALDQIKSSVNPLQVQGSGFAFSCGHTVNRLKDGPEDWNSIIGSGTVYNDASFEGQSTLFQLPWAGWSEWWYYGGNSWYSYKRLGELYPEATMFGDTGEPSWDDVNQGYSGTCYILAAMAGLAEWPELVNNVFRTQEVNDEGIYAFQFYIRGKPWLVTIDDKVLVDAYDNVEFVDVVDNHMWAALAQKAFMKVKGNMAASQGGFVENGIRSLTGIPVETYYSYESDATTTYTMMKSANDLEYILGAGTYGQDTMQNACGVVAGHAYSLIEVFDVTEANADTGFNDVVGEVYMVRNPWGDTLKTDGTYSSASCVDDAYYTDSYGDSCSWYNGAVTDEDSQACGAYDDGASSSNTSCCVCGGGTAVTPFWATGDYASQIPHGVDYTTALDSGIFFLDKDEFLSCFDDYQVGHYRDAEGYTDDWADQEGDTGYSRAFTVTPPAKSGDLYFTVETYYLGMVSQLCQMFFNTPWADWILYQNGAQISRLEYDEYWTVPVMVGEADYEAGDEFEIVVEYIWSGWYVNDYTVKVYSSQDLDVVDEELGTTNQLNMDGCAPSGIRGDYVDATC